MANGQFPFAPPADNSTVEDVTEAQWEAMAAQWADGSGVVSGMACAPTGSSMTVPVGAGLATVLGTWAQFAGGSVVIDPNTSGATRTDLIVLRRSVTNRTLAPAVSKGVPGGNAATPVRSGDNAETPLAAVTVGNSVGVIRAQDVRDAREFLGYRSRPNASTATLSSMPRIGEVATVGGRLRTWDGSQWLTYDAENDHPRISFRFGSITLNNGTFFLPWVYEDAYGITPPVGTLDRLTIPPGAGGRWQISATAKFNGAHGALLMRVLNIERRRADTGPGGGTTGFTTEMTLYDNWNVNFLAIIDSGGSLAGDTSNLSGVTLRRVSPVS